jgi:hypothetical protein
VRGWLCGRVVHAKRQLCLYKGQAGSRPQLPELVRPHSSQSSCCALHPRRLPPTALRDLDVPFDVSARGHESHATNVRRTARQSKPDKAQQPTLPLPALLLTHGSVPEGPICLGRPYAPGPTFPCVPSKYDKAHGRASVVLAGRCAWGWEARPGGAIVWDAIMPQYGIRGAPGALAAKSPELDVVASIGLRHVS